MHFTYEDKHVHHEDYHEVIFILICACPTVVIHEPVWLQQASPEGDAAGQRT